VVDQSNLPLGKAQTLNEIQAHSMAQTSFAMVMAGHRGERRTPARSGGSLRRGVVLAAERTTKSGSAWRSVRKAAMCAVSSSAWARAGPDRYPAGDRRGHALTPVMSALLYGIGPMDPITYAIMAIVLGAVTLLANIFRPAARHVWHPSSPCGRVSEARACESCSKFERYATGSMAEASSSSSYLFKYFFTYALVTQSRSVANCRSCRQGRLNNLACRAAVVTMSG